MRLVDAGQAKGKSHALNVGIRAAHGRALLFCDADDTMAPGWLAAMAAALDRHAFVAARMDIRALNPDWTLAHRRQAQEHGLGTLPHAPHCRLGAGSTLGFRRAVFDAVGGFDPAFVALEDIDFCVRAHLAGFTAAIRARRGRQLPLPRQLAGIYRQGYAYAHWRALLRRRYAAEAASRPPALAEPRRPALALAAAAAGLGVAAPAAEPERPGAPAPQPRPGDGGAVRRAGFPCRPARRPGTGARRDALHPRRGGGGLNRAGGRPRPASAGRGRAPAPARPARGRHAGAGRWLKLKLSRRGRLVERLLRPFFGSIVAVRTGEKLIALTFDDGPDPEWTPLVLDALARHGMRATFFLVGERAARHPELVARILAEGHETGSHSWDHPSLPELPPAAVAEQIARTRAVLPPGGAALLRPPYGHQSLATWRLARREGYRVVMWSIAAGDWRGDDGETSPGASSPRPPPAPSCSCTTRSTPTRSRRSATAGRPSPRSGSSPSALAGWRFVTVSELLARGRPDMRYWSRRGKPEVARAAEVGPRRGCEASRPMIISHSRKFIFVKTYKTAGSSLEIALSKYCAKGDVLTPLDGDEEDGSAASSAGSGRRTTASRRGATGPRTWCGSCARASSPSASTSIPPPGRSAG